MIAVHFRKGMLERASRTFGRIAFSPTVATQRPSQFKPRPTFRVHEANSSHDLVGCFFFNRPNAISTKVPVTHERGHLPPGLHSVHRLAVAKKTHDFGVGANVV